MLLGFVWKTLVGLTALSLIIYAVTPEASISYLLKLFALNWGITILATIAWPYIRGVRKGDPLLVRDEDIPILFSFPNAVALSNGRLNGYVEMKLVDGSVGIGKIIKYQGIINNAEVELLEQHTAQIEISN